MRIFILLLTGLTFALVSAACGGGDEDAETQEPSYTVDETITCLQRAGVRQVEKNAAEFAEGLAEDGALEGRLSNVGFAIIFESSAEAAIDTETTYASQFGGTWVPGVPLRDLLKRSANTVIAYERRPGARVTTAVEGCLGGNASIDAEVDREYGR